MESDTVVVLLLVVGLGGLALWLLMRNTSGAVAPATTPPCGVSVQGVYIPCSTAATLVKGAAGLINQSPGGIVSYGAANGPSVQGNHAGIVAAAPGTPTALATLADAMCACYHGMDRTYNGLSPCAYVKKAAPEIDTCVKGDCDCHPTFQGEDGNHANPTPQSTQLCYATSRHGKVCVTVQSALIPGVKVA